MSRTQSILSLAVCFIICFSAAFFGALFQPGDWYIQLTKPGWTPPSSVFGPVWTLLYTLMAISAWLVWRKRGFPRASLTLSIFLLQLALNALWSWIFFGLHRIGLAFAEIVVLWFTILATTILFWRRAFIAGLLFLPYTLWVLFAAMLNFYLWRMNP